MGIARRLSWGVLILVVIIVIGIIGLLVGLSLVSYAGAQKQARDTQRKSDLSQYRTALEAYSAANDGAYPLFDGSFANISTSTVCTSDLSNFISECLEDPKGTNLYKYQSDSLTYILWATLETGGWWEVCSDGRSDKITIAAPTNVTCDIP